MFVLCLSLPPSADSRHFHAFPTRRSSDLPKTMLRSFCTSREPLLLKVAPLSMKMSLKEARLPQTAEPALLSVRPDRKSTRLNSSHIGTSYAVLCLQKTDKVPAVQVRTEVA